ncbi:UxaA family hydrolase [Candidatus Bipolaricaulota bacterium]|nr:UxaA family hydrolase [Candidatus Bipolaricaulota bacterium]
MKYQIFIHEKEDDVGVAVTDLEEGRQARAKVLKSQELVEKQVTPREEVPLTHKIALVDLEEGDEVIEYGEVIGRASQQIEAGEHVHTHNIKSLRV